MIQGKFIKLIDVEKTPKFQLVSVAAKVTKVTDPAYVPSGKLKQDLTISDVTGSV